MSPYYEDLTQLFFLDDFRQSDYLGNFDLPKTKYIRRKKIKKKGGHQKHFLTLT